MHLPLQSRAAALASFLRSMPAWPTASAVPLAALFAHRFPVLPAWHWAATVGAAALLLLVMGRFNARPILRWCALFVTSCAWTFVCAHAGMEQRILPSQEGHDFLVQGHVTTMPQVVTHGVRFGFRVERCVRAAAPDAQPGATGRDAGDISSIPCPAGADLRVGRYAGFGAAASPSRSTPVPQPGERWQFALRLKQVHGLANPGAFDSEQRALQEGIDAYATVLDGKRQGGSNRRLSGFATNPRALLEAARTHLRDALHESMKGHRADASAVVVALAIGDQAAIGRAWWDIFNRTGVSHLMSISGLHITMLAGMAGAVAGRLLRIPAIGRPGLLLRVDAGRLRWLVAVAVAFIYSLLAGWGVPAQRTCWMLAVAGLAMTSGRSGSITSVLSLAAAVITLIDPWAPLSPGFWLSFASVAAICWHASVQRVPRLRAPRAGPGGVAAPPLWRTRTKEVLAEAISSQWAATLALVPLGALFFSSVPLLGPIANSFAIPLVSIIITPAALAGTVIAAIAPTTASLILAPVVWVTGWLLDTLRTMSELPQAIHVLATPDAASLLLATGAVLILLAPIRLPAKPAAFAALLPLLARGPSPVADGELRVTALDVGQGAAILVETPAGRLLFDTGPSTGADSDAGASVLLPYLKSRGIRKLDAVVISHADDDHSGGAASVLAGIEVGWVAGSMEPEHPSVAARASDYRRCARGQWWQWGDTRFEFLHPGPERTSRKPSTNANSCVLKVSSAAGDVLLTGDIETAQERFLADKLGVEAMRARVLVAPHHGSNGSSSLSLLHAVGAQYVLVQAGYRNRFGHPGTKAMMRYAMTRAHVLRTDRDGAITLQLRGAQQPVDVQRYRFEVPRYWRVPFVERTR